MTRFDDEYFASLEADLQRREARDRSAKADEILSRREAVVTKSPPTPRRDRQAMSNDVTASWQNYIAGEIERSSKSWLEVAMTAVGEVLAEERKAMRAEFELELTKLRAEFLQSELDRERGVKPSLRVVGDAKDMIG